MATGAPVRKEPVIFGHAVEALFDFVMKGRLDAAVRQRFRALGIELDQPLHVAYPVPVWFDAIALCAELAHPGVPRDEAWYRIGRQLSVGYSHTALGKALFGLTRLVGWKRAQQRLTRVLQTGCNYLKTQGVELPEGGFEVTLTVLPEFREALGGHPGFDPHFMHGCLEGILDAGGAPYSRAEQVSHTPGELLLLAFRPRARMAAAV
jgi:uncharacterized protein (TIGR02265 family)